MALDTAISDEFDTWDDQRNATAAKVLAAEKTAAVDVAEQKIKDLFGSDTDETDVLAVKLGFLIAVDWLRNYASMKIDSDDEKFLKALKEWTGDEFKRRKQRDETTYQKKVDDSTISNLFPFRTTS